MGYSVNPFQIGLDFSQDLGETIPLTDLSNVTITGTPADNELLAYDSGSGEWINQTAVEAGIDLSLYLPLAGGTMSGNLGFSTGTITIAGIQNQNLLDKTDTESITALWTYTQGILVDLSSNTVGVRIQANSAGQGSNLLLIEDDVGNNYFRVAGGGDVVMGYSVSGDRTIEFFNTSTLQATFGYDFSAGAVKLSFDAFDSSDVQTWTATTSKFLVDVTMADATDIILDTTTGTKIGTATSQKLGFYNATPIVQPSAYTQTYSTATKTHSNPTALATFRPMGEMHVTDNATATTITTQDTWTQVQDTFTDGHLDSFDTPNVYTLRYTGSTTTAFHMGCTISFESASANQEVKFVLIKNATVNGSNEYSTGTILSGGTIRTKTGSAGDNVSSAIHIMTSLAQNDTITLFVQNNTSTANITIIDCNLFGMGITQDLADDIANVKQVTNQVIDDLQTLGLVG